MSTGDIPITLTLSPIRIRLISLVQKTPVEPHFQPAHDFAALILIFQRLLSPLPDRRSSGSAKRRRAGSSQHSNRYIPPNQIPNENGDWLLRTRVARIFGQHAPNDSPLQCLPGPDSPLYVSLFV